MLGRFTNTFKVLSQRFIHKYSLKMENAYFRSLPETEQFHFTFRYENKELKIDRPFNLVRQLSEPVSTFLTRVGANVEKIIAKKNKKKNPDSLPKDMKVQLVVNGQTIDNGTICSELFNSDNKISLNVLDNTYNVVINSPWIDAIALPSSILATYPVYASKFEAFNTDVNQSEFIWYASKDKKVWSEHSKNRIFIPSNDLIDSHLKLTCTPMKEGIQGPTVEVESSNKVQAGPGLCPFETRHQFTQNRTLNNVFRVVTYNILADLYCDSDYTRETLHPYCPPYALELDYRKQLIMKELMGYNADIICLQEVDRKVFKHDLEPFLSNLGFEGEYAIKGGEVAEGAACFFHKEKFSKLEANRIVYCECIDKDPLFSYIWSRISENPKLVTRILDLKTILQTVLLQSKDNEKELILVGNTHLYFHPDADHIRLIQGGLGITYIQNYMELLKEKYPGKRISVIFCGDFNSVPECGIYKLFTTGSVPEDYIDYRSNEEEAIKNLKLEQNIPLASACGTPQYTNFTTGFADCLDYIYFQTSNLKVSQVIPLPSNEELTENTALPSIYFPSDHVALISDLEWL